MAKIETATDITTDIPARKSTFKVDPNIDYQEKLVEFSATNTHLAGYTIEE